MAMGVRGLRLSLRLRPKPKLRPQAKAELLSPNPRFSLLIRLGHRLGHRHSHRHRLSLSRPIKSKCVPVYRS